MKPLDFIVTARDLVHANSKGRTRETNIRRAVSTTYYALFHCLATSNANMLVGGPGARRSQPAWRQTYRALQHGTARQRCEHQGIIIKFPDEIQDFAERFAELALFLIDILQGAVNITCRWACWLISTRPGKILITAR